MQYLKCRAEHPIPHPYPVSVDRADIGWGNLLNKKDMGGGVFAEWTTPPVNAIARPMCVMIIKVQPGFSAGFTVEGKDTSGRYGPRSNIEPYRQP
ncbi:unnamed protein product [Arctogadus glacialis]